MTRGSFSTAIWHNGGGRFEQREQGYHVTSVRASITKIAFFRALIQKTFFVREYDTKGKND